MMPLQKYVVLKVDVDTDVGTRMGVPRLVDILRARDIPATFLFSLGPDNTGRAVRRLFRPGFLKKVTRTKVGKLYGWRTLLSGTLLPATHIGRTNEKLLQSVARNGFEVGIHCHDHFKWQDFLQTWDIERTRNEFSKAVEEFQRIFGCAPKGAGAPGWQANKNSLAVYDDYQLLYGSDTRGTAPFYPCIDGQLFKTLQIPTTLPTLDELLGRAAFPESGIPGHYISLLKQEQLNVWTIHAEIEGQSKAGLFVQILDLMAANGYQFTTLEQAAASAQENQDAIPVCRVDNATIEGRTGMLAFQGDPAESLGLRLHA